MRPQPIDCPIAGSCWDDDCKRSRCREAYHAAAERVLYEIAREQSAVEGRLVPLPISEREAHIARILHGENYATRLLRHLDDVLAGHPPNFDPRDEYVNGILQLDL
jgi:hypothetical protein